MTRHLWQIQPVRDALMVAAVVGVVYLGYRLSLVTVPILLALAFAYMVEPLVRRMTRVRWVSRQGAAAAIIAGAVLLVGIPVVLGSAIAIGQGTSAVRTIGGTTGDFLTASRKTLAVLEVDRGIRIARDEPPAGDGAELLFSGLEGKEGEVVESARAASEAFERLPPVIRDACWELLRRQMDRLRDGAATTDEPMTGQEQAAPESGEGDQASDQRPTPGDIGGSTEPAGEDGKSQRPARAPASSGSSALYESLDAAMQWINSNAAAIAKRAVGTGVDAVSSLIRGVTSLGVIGFMAFLTAFFFFFFSTSYQRVLDFAQGLLPSQNRERIVDLVQKFDRVISGFIRGRLLIALIQSAFFTIGYWIIGVPVPLIIGPIVGFLSIVPYLALVGIPVTIIGLALVSSGQGIQSAWWWVIFAPMVVYYIGQALDDYILTPVIQGKSTDMDTPTILFASIAGGVLLGVFGLLIAIPIAACLKIVIREVLWPRFREWRDGRAKDFLPLGGDE